MDWQNPPLNKIYEALGAIGDKRIQVEGNTAKVYSSSGNKYYDVVFDPDSNAIMANDNGSYYIGYLGYPAIAFLLAKSLVPYEPELAEYLTGFAWKDINQKFKNNYEKTDAYIDEKIVEKFGIDVEQFHDALRLILNNVTNLNLKKLKTSQRPPSGY